MIAVVLARPLEHRALDGEPSAFDLLPDGRTLRRIDALDLQVERGRDGLVVRDVDLVALVMKRMDVLAPIGAVQDSIAPGGNPSLRRRVVLISTWVVPARPGKIVRRWIG